MTPEKRVEHEIKQMNLRRVRLQSKLSDVNYDMADLRRKHNSLKQQAQSLQFQIDQINGAINRLQTEGLPEPEEEDEDRPVWLDGQTTFVPISPK